MSPLERHCCVAGLNRVKSIYHLKLVHCHVCAHDGLFLVACQRAAFIFSFIFWHFLFESIPFFICFFVELFRTVRNYAVPE